MKGIRLVAGRFRGCPPVQSDVLFPPFSDPGRREAWSTERGIFLMLLWLTAGCEPVTIRGFSAKPLFADAV